MRWPTTLFTTRPTRPHRPFYRHVHSRFETPEPAPCRRYWPGPREAKGRDKGGGRRRVYIAFQIQCTHVRGLISQDHIRSAGIGKVAQTPELLRTCTGCRQWGVHYGIPSHDFLFLFLPWKFGRIAIVPSPDGLDNNSSTSPPGQEMISIAMRPTF